MFIHGTWSSQILNKKQTPTPFEGAQHSLQKEEIMEHQKSKKRIWSSEAPPTWCFRRWFRSFFFHLISKAHRTKRQISTDNLVGSGTPFRGGWNETAETGVQGDLLRLKSESNSTPIPSMGLVYLPRFTRNTSQMYTYGLFGYRLFTIYLHVVESYGKCREI